MNFSLANMNITANNSTTELFFKYQIMPSSSEIIIYSAVVIICCIGVPLNGIVIWLLGFQIKRNPFTILILNLAIADFVFLISKTIYCIRRCLHFNWPQIPRLILFFLQCITYISGLFLLTAISIDRCVAVLFPIWHRCSRPKYLSPAICVFLWICSFLLVGIHRILQYGFFSKAIWTLHFVVTAVVCLPLITTSTVILFTKICLKSKQIKRGRLLVMILITLLCFLILTLPLYIYVIVIHLPNNSFNVIQLDYYLNLSASLNSSINPVIYYLVGRKKRTRTRESIKVVFQEFSEKKQLLKSDKSIQTQFQTLCKCNILACL